MNAFNLLPQELQDALKKINIIDPTPVQQAALPPVLQGRDILATAQTGTGKTFAFLLPLMTLLQQQPGKTALVLSPTRELAQQTQDALLSLLADKKELPSALVIGGDNIHKQFADLRRKPRLIIGTPGRIIDHIGRKTLSLKNVGFFVLDEADRMLDMGFIPDVRKIGAAISGPHQTLLFSATLPKEIVSLADGFLKDPARVQIGSVTRPVDLVVQQIVRVGTRERLGQLLHELDNRKSSVLVFMKSKHGADRLAKQLKQYGHKANALHGDLRQNRRRQVMEMFRDGSVPVLVATDVAARGIDVADIGCVINYDLPQCPEDYIHRIGRTGRAGSVGTALSFVTEDESKWKTICRVCQLGKVTEQTKTARPLPAPKFTPEQPKKKTALPAAEKRRPAPKTRREPARTARDKARPSAQKAASRTEAEKTEQISPAAPTRPVQQAQAPRAGKRNVLNGASAKAKRGENQNRKFTSARPQGRAAKNAKNAGKETLSSLSRQAANQEAVKAVPSLTGGFKVVRVGSARKAAPEKNLSRRAGAAPKGRFKRAASAFAKFFKRKKR